MNGSFNSTTSVDSTTFGTTQFDDPFEKSYKIETIMYQVVGLIVLCIGTVGHIFSIMVMVSSKSIRVQSSAIYITTLSLAGLLTIYTGLLRYVVVVYNGWETHDVRLTSELACRIHAMLTYLSLQYFAWLQATIAVDRFMAVWFPIMYKTFCNWKQGLTVVLIELVLVICLNSIVYVMTGFSESGHCGIRKEDLAKNWFYIDLLSFSLLPAVVIIVSNSLLLHKLIKSKKNSSAAHDKIFSLTVMLITVNFIFLLTTLPISVYYILKASNDELMDPPTAYQVENFFTILQYLGSASTFFVYCITGTKFRNKFKKIICGPFSLPKLSRTATESTVMSH